MTRKQSAENKKCFFYTDLHQESKDHSMVNKEAFDLIKRKETVQNLLAITRGKIF